MVSILMASFMYINYAHKQSGSGFVLSWGEARYTMVFYEHTVHSHALSHTITLTPSHTSKWTGLIRDTMHHLIGAIPTAAVSLP
jgi:hypothetical protein